MKKKHATSKVLAQQARLLTDLVELTQQKYLAP
jgi:hypothetical protein